MRMQSELRLRPVTRDKDMETTSSQHRESEAFVPARDQVSGANVLLIRRRADPTDDLYVSAPLQSLAACGRISLAALDFGWGLRTAGQLRPHLRDCTHVIVSRYCPGAWVRALIENCGRRFQLIYLLDDDIPAAPATHTLPLTYRLRMARVARREFAGFLRGADRVVVTSEYLAGKYRADNVALLEPANIWPVRSLDHFQDPETIVISFHATAIHQADLAAIAPALREVHDRRAKVRLEIMTDGRVPLYLRRLPRCRVRRDMPWPEYKAFVQRAQSHIGLAPLMDSPYNRGKSHVKLFDITAMGAAGVYSNRSPYAGVIAHGVNGILAGDDVDAWTAALIELVDHPGRTKRMVESAQTRVAEIGDPERLVKYWRGVFGLGEKK